MSYVIRFTGRGVCGAYRSTPSVYSPPSPSSCFQLLTAFSLSERKLRCDGNRPTCHTCEKKGVECQWDPAPRRRGPGKKNRNAMSHATASSAEPSQPTASTSTLAGGSSSSSRENSTPFTSSSRRQQQNPVPLPNPFALPQPHQHPPVEEVAEEGPVPHGYYNPRSRQALQRPQPQYPPEQHQGQRILDINPAPSPVPSQGSVTLPSLHSLGLLDTPERATRPVRPSPYVMPDAMMQGPPPGPPPPSYEQYRSPQHTLPAIPNFDDDDDDRPPRLVQANFEQIENLRRSQASSSRRGRSTGRPPLARGGGSSRGRGRGGRPGDDDHDEGTGSILGASGYRTGLPPKGT
ncbi:hypothetical protein SISNIDRAFT_67184 [Sistotremastrum niveocremeum HHB9708]|uniref:Zn(2)-C6 fungal-type domain-containing protein n=1 Tax=Sistotremastrum niveocremeum HHB9708 TaxID=1314777 RepID=A0A164V1L7_9AGAM|nr:hypothetical protein SISNIDRAFT_67184 [Sistotremastrum niveocremeum HHB9708]